MLRTHTCGDLCGEHIGQKVALCGWVKNVRSKGALCWIDLRDRYGITQILLEEGQVPSSLFDIAHHLGREDVLLVRGEVIQRISPNPNLSTGQIEIVPSTLERLNKASLPPFLIEEETDGLEELRMQYRYLDLRRKPMQENLILRHEINQTIRQYLNDQKFLEMETPTLIKSTPEGARDFVVPARLHPNLYYALPQSPQIFKQLFMVGGFDRYYQIVKCFRDEDLRADRQPEFTQLDLEMSFVDEKDVQNLVEGLVITLLDRLKGIKLKPFPRMTYADAIARYGSDKPNLQWGMPLIDMTTLLKGKGFAPFDTADHILAISLPHASTYSRKKMDRLTTWLKTQNPQVGPLLAIKYHEDGSLATSLTKFFDETLLRSALTHAQSKTGDILLLLAGPKENIHHMLGKLRLHIIQEDQIKPTVDYAPLWVTDFPLLEWDQEEQRYHASHHPFTSPQLADIPLLDSAPQKVKARAYDLVLNGTEIGGGSIRIHDAALQTKVFDTLGLPQEEQKQQFGFLLKALQYGAPPHGGFAAGLDRIALLLGGGTSIRDYIPFPKNNMGRDVMADAPAPLPK